MDRTRHHEARNVGRSQIEFGRADQRYAKSAERMAERGSLRHGGHVHHAQRDSDSGAEHECDDNPFVVDDAVMQQRASDGEHHADLASANARAEP